MIQGSSVRLRCFAGLCTFAVPPPLSSSAQRTLCRVNTTSLYRRSPVASLSFMFTAALTKTVRHEADQGISHTHGVQYVPARVTEALEEVGNNSSSDEGNENSTGSCDAAAANVEPVVVDFTTGVASEKLDKLYRRADKGTQFLSPPERQLFTKMIYDRFYKDEGGTAMDPVMMYQASLEIQWVEEWMAGVAREKNYSTDDARREVKKALLERVDLHKPLSYIIGSQPFFGCDIHCEEPLLCPRPETEMWTHWLVYKYLNRMRSSTGKTITGGGDTVPLSILDVCCGTGCIGVALAKHVPSAVVTALDILPEAVKASRQNARRNGISDARYKAIQSDMFECFMEQNRSEQSHVAAEGNSADEANRSNEKEMEERPLGTIKPEFAGTFDVIVSNPPYVLPAQYIDLPRTITHWESKTALVGDDYREFRQYLYFKELCVHGAKLLKPRHQRPCELRDTPNVLVEVGVQAHMVADLMEKSGLWKNVSIHLDYAQQERWVSAVSTH